jgi:nicotinate phosphoribosyltransferase
LVTKENSYVNIRLLPTNGRPILLESGISEKQAVFQLILQNMPFKNSYAITCGLSQLIKSIQSFRFEDALLSEIAKLKNQQQSMFNKKFINYLRQLEFSCSIDAVPDGTLVFPNEPILLIKGSIIQCQLLEALLVNIFSFSTLVATKTSRICLAAAGDPVFEFGLKRAPGLDNSLLAAEAAYIGGCVATSNIKAGIQYAIPIEGLMSYAWVMLFSHELEAFRASANVMHDKTILLLDTYDVIHAVNNALIVGTELRRRKHDLFALQLDYKNAGKYCKKVRSLLNQTGFTNTKIIVSGDLDEYRIKELKDKKLPIDMWTTGTRLATAADQAALNMDCKLVAVYGSDEQEIQYRMQISKDKDGCNTPGIKQIRRFKQGNKMLGDLIYDTEFGVTKGTKFDSFEYNDLLLPIFRDGDLVYKAPSATETRSRTINSYQNFVRDNLKNYRVLTDPTLGRLQRDLLDI